jgi:biopolymer transport protein ExbD
MIKILFIFLILLLFFGVSSDVSAQSPEYKLPAFVKNASEDENVNKEPSMQFAFTKDGKLFYKETLISAQILPQTIKNHFESQLSVRHAYIKGDVEGKTATLFEISNALFKSEINDIRLVVIPYKLVVIPSEKCSRNDGKAWRRIRFQTSFIQC